MACIITFARSWQALVATRALGKAGIKVITADTDEFATSYFSKYSKARFIYPKDEKKFVAKLIERAKFYKKKFNEEIVLIPIHKETFIISKYRKQLEKHMKLCIEDYEKLSSIHNKSLLPMYLKKHKIPHPKTIVVKDILKLYRIVPTLKFPVFLKLTETAASIGLKKIDERDDLIYEYKNMIKEYGLKPCDYPIIQEGVEGRDYCVTALFNHGKKKAMMTYINIKCHPYKSGPGVYRKNIKAPQMEAVAERLLKGIKWHGVAELDFRMGKDNKPYLIEVNPRFWGGLNQSVASNLNYPLLVHDIAMHGDCQKVDGIKQGIRTENLATAILALFDELKKDERKQKDLEKLKSQWKKMLKGNFDLKNFLTSLNNFNKKQHNKRILDEFIRRRKLVKDDMIDIEDPLIAMGIFFPVNMLLKYGKVDKEMLTGEK